MKEIEVETIVKEKQYQAVDGTIFSDKDECRRYEESARGVLEGRFSSLIVNKQNSWELNKGYDDHDVYGVKIESSEDMATVLQLYYIDHPYILRKDGAYKEYQERYENLVEQAYRTKDILLMGRNCDGELYFMDTCQNMINSLKAFRKPKSVEDIIEV